MSFDSTQTLEIPSRSLLAQNSGRKNTRLSTRREAVPLLGQTHPSPRGTATRGILPIDASSIYLSIFTILKSVVGRRDTGLPQPFGSSRSINICRTIAIASELRVRIVGTSGTIIPVIVGSYSSYCLNRVKEQSVRSVINGKINPGLRSLASKIGVF